MKKYSSKRKIFYGLVSVLFLVFLMEAIASIADYQEHGKYAFALIGLIKNARTVIHGEKVKKQILQNQGLVRKDSAQKVNQLIADENAAANRLVYEPWLEYRMADFSGQFVNTHGLNRKTMPATAGGGMDTDTISIYFFGGSTMYGFNVADQETIPSFFTHIYQQKFPKGTPIKVCNYGIPYYYSFQELLLLSKLLYTQNHPAVVIFLDGLNDCLQVGAAANRQPFFSSAFEQLFLQENDRLRINDSVNLPFLPGPLVDSIQYAHRVLDNLLANLQAEKKLSLSYGVTPFFFIQPVPYYHYTNRDKDPICIKEDLAQFTWVYDTIAQKCEPGSDIFFLGDMLVQEKGLPFIDNIHYSPEMNEKIAQAIADKVFDKILPVAGK